MSRVKIYRLVIVCLVLFTSGSIMAQDNVGIGTLNPNPKAILDLETTTKGFLAPRMTTAERIAIFPALTEAGLLVYDTDLGSYYYWDGTQWLPIASGGADADWTISGSDMYSAVSGNVGIGVTFPNTKFHVNGTVKLENLGSNTSNTRVLTQTSGGDVTYRILPAGVWDGDDVNDNDSDPTNEYNSSINYDSQSGTLSLVDGGGTVSTSINFNPNDADSDPTNEYQSLSSSVSGSTVTLNISNGSGTTIDIDDADADPTNEIQTLTVNQVGNTVNWSLSQGGGNGSFGLNDNDWTGAGTGNMYPSTLTDSVGIGTSTPSYLFDVNGSARVTEKVYFANNDYYIENDANDFLFFSEDDFRFESGFGHDVRYYHSGSEAIVNFGLNGTDVMTLRGATGGAFENNVGVGTTTPKMRLQVVGNVMVGEVNPPGFTGGGNNYGDLIFFAGGPGYTNPTNFDSQNTDSLFIGRYNTGPDQSEIRIGIGDNSASPATEIDRLSVGTYNSANGITDFDALYNFESDNPGSSNAPMLSISSAGIPHVRDYHGGVTITKDASAAGQYINLNRGAITTWSIGYEYGTDNFAIGLGNTNDAAFTSPSLVLGAANGYLGLGLTNPNYRIELPNTVGGAGQGRANAWVTYSDGRFKKNREAMPKVMDAVMSLDPMTYQWEGFTYNENGEVIATGEMQEGREYGFIAQEVYELFPQLVKKPEDEQTDTWAMDYPRLTVVLTKALQEQQMMLDEEKAAHACTQTELDEVKDELNDLQSKVEVLEKKMDKLTGANLQVSNE